MESKKKIAALESAGTPETAADSSDADTPFKNFSATDYDGNKVDDSLFSNNAVTVLNFWFTGCKPCVGELSKLNEMNEAIKSMGGEVVGINTETLMEMNLQLRKQKGPEKPGSKIS